MNPPELGDFVGLGELLWDVFPDERRPGGAPANVAFHATQLGFHGAVVSRVGSDELGRNLVSHLSERGVGTQCVQIDDQHPTGTVTVHVGESGSAGYTIHEDVAWDHLEATEAIRASLRNAAAVCFGSLAQRSPTTRETIRKCLEHARVALRVFDVNLRPPHVDAGVIDASLQRCDVLKLNEDEVPVVADLLGDVPQDPASFAMSLHDRYGLDVVCITRGANGCYVWRESETVDVPGVENVKVVDTVGAGDAFTAGLTCGLLRGWPIEAAAQCANEIGALVASSAGAMPPLGAPFAALVERFDQSV